jgi:preprotein translocase subunit SecB
MIKFESELLSDFNPDEKSEYQVHLDKNIQREKNQPVASVIVGWAISPEKSKNPEIRIEIVMQAFFKWNEELSDKQIEDLLNLNGVSLIISYMRPIVASMSYNATGKSIDIPFADLRDAS